MLGDAAITAQRKAYGKKTIRAPFLLQTEESIPDYWGDYRYTPQWTWSHTENPRYANSTSWVEDGHALKGYDTPLKMDGKELGKIEANWGKVPKGQKAASFAQK